MLNIYYNTRTFWIEYCCLLIGSPPVPLFRLYFLHFRMNAFSFVLSKTLATCSTCWHSSFVPQIGCPPSGPRFNLLEFGCKNCSRRSCSLNHAALNLRKVALPFWKLLTASGAPSSPLPHIFKQGQGTSSTSRSTCLNTSVSPVFEARLSILKIRIINFKFN